MTETVLLFSDHRLRAGCFAQRGDGDRSGGRAPGLPGPGLRQAADGRGRDEGQGRQVHGGDRLMPDRRHTLLRTEGIHGKDEELFMLCIIT